MFEVRNGYEAFRVDEKNMTCSCRQWQLTGIQCSHGFAAIYFLHKNPDSYIPYWYTKQTFASVYNHFIYPLNGMSQWPPTDYQKPLPPIARRMPGRPPHKRKTHASEANDSNRTRIGRVGRLMHCTICGGEGHNRKTCKSTDVDGGSNGEGDINAVGVAYADGVSSSRGGSNARSGTKNKSGSSAKSGIKNRCGSSSRPIGMGVSFNQEGQPMIGVSAYFVYFVMY